MSSDDLLVEKRGEVEWVTLNRPESLNALNTRLTTALRTYFADKYDDMATRVIVLRGAGRAFCAGLDLKEAGGGGQPIEESLRRQVSIRDIYKGMRRCPQPIVSLIQGAACGGGFSLALASDIRILGESARMNAAYITIGASGCDMGSSYFLPRLVGASLASELLLTGRFILPDEAVAHRLASRVVPDDELEHAADDLIAAILANTRFGVSLTKDALNFAIDAPGLDAAMAMEDRNQMLAISSGEFAARVKAFNSRLP